MQFGEFGAFGDKVVALSGTQGQMRFPVIGQVQAYWEALRAGRTVPLRSEVDPRGIEHALEYAFVLERVAPQIARFRLAGMHLNDLMGMEVRGMPLTAFFAPTARADLALRLESVFSEPAIADFALTAESGAGKPPLQARLLILPLRSDLGDITRALGCLVANGQIGRAPRRFEVDSFRFTKVEPGRPASPGPVMPVVSGFAESAKPFTGPRASVPRAQGGRHLRLVKSDD
jgi:hypothetical protein